MGLDIRKPIGLLLALIGAQLTAFGLFGGAQATARGANINVEWGATLLVSGCAFLFFSRKSRG